LVNEANRECVSKAATGGTAEVELGRVATQRAVRPSVRSFAERMVADDGRANAELAALARRKGLDVPTALEPSQQAMRDRLSGLSGPDFDRAYMSEIVRDHTEDIALFERTADISSDQDLKALATGWLPMLRDHLARARPRLYPRAATPAPCPIRLPDAVLDELRARLARVRWPDEIPGEPWRYGTDLAYMKSLVGYWRDRYDWRAQEVELNARRQFTV